MTTAYWSPNQATIAQVETYTFSAPNSVGNTYSATINGKTVTYTSVAGDTAATVASALFDLLNRLDSIAPELTEITFANPSSGVVTATASAAGTPFANVAGTSAGLVMSTGNGLANGIATTHTTRNSSPSDVADLMNWLRVTPPAPPVRQLPQNSDDVVVHGTSTPMLWNLDQLTLVQFGTYTRWQSMSGDVGLPENNPGGYTEWRARDFKFSGPQGSVPAGGLVMVLGYGGPDGGSGPSYESYDVGSQQATLACIGGGQIRFRGVHTANTFTALGGVDLQVASRVGEVAGLSSSTIDGGSTLGIGARVVWTAGSTLTMSGGTATLNSAPAVLAMSNGAQATFPTDQLTWPTITAQGGCALVWLAGGTVTNLTLSQACTLDKSQDARALTITNSTIDGDTCQIIDPLNVVSFTNATVVKQQVTSGPFQFTGTRTMKVV